MTDSSLGVGRYSAIVDEQYRALCEWQARESRRIVEECERRAEWQRILYQGLPLRTRLRAYDRMVAE